MPFYSVGQEALEIGSKAPNFNGIDQYGNQIALIDELKESIVIVQFYRGEWCPHCNRHMAQLQDSVRYLNQLGAKIIAITPENQENIALTTAQSGAKFTIIQDLNHEIMDAYKTTFKLGIFKNIGYNFAGINVKKRSGFDERYLPVPATYIIDSNGFVIGRYFNEDYSTRMSIKSMIEIIKKN